MKKIMMMFLCICTSLVLGACGDKIEDSPKVVTKAFLDAYRKKDVDNIKKFSEWKDYSAKALTIQESDYIDGVDKKLQKQVFEMMQYFDHKEGKESIQDDVASVKVTLTIYDFEPVIQSGMQEATLKAEELSKEVNVSDREAQAQINTILFQNMKNAKKTKKKTIVVNLIKSDGNWLVSNNNMDIQNLLIENVRSLQNINLS